MSYGPKGIERRRSMRVDAVLPARILRLDDQKVEQGRLPLNISTTGIRVITNEELPIGMKVGIEIYDFDERPIPISAIADVVRCEQLAADQSGGQVAMQFVSIRETDRQRVQHFITQHLNQGPPA
ncbi:MAG: PilZ domain-containing protein [Candidatus Alcyoniella australis]|nr:PilZ domain-containing protein [Candidatus Alcyoniella australis]